MHIYASLRECPSTQIKLTIWNRGLYLPSLVYSLMAWDTETWAIM